MYYLCKSMDVDNQLFIKQNMIKAIEMALMSGDKYYLGAKMKNGQLVKMYDSEKCYQDYLKTRK